MYTKIFFNDLIYTLYNLFFLKQQIGTLISKLGNALNVNTNEETLAGNADADASYSEADPDPT